MSKRPESRPPQQASARASWVSNPRVTVVLCVLIVAASVLALIAVFPSADRPGSGKRENVDIDSQGRQHTAASDGAGVNKAEDADKSSAPANRRTTPADPQSLLGVWNRPGETYFLEIRRYGSDGTLEAAYFNPRPIKVAKAAWRREDQSIRIMVELRDVGYPGSTYNLVYHADQDILAGEYFQAATGATYQVEFVRYQPMR